MTMNIGVDLWALRVLKQMDPNLNLKAFGLSEAAFGHSLCVSTV